MMAEEDTLNKMSSDTQEMKQSVDKEELKAAIVGGKEEKLNQEVKKVPPENGIHKPGDETSKTEELGNEEKSADDTKEEKDEDTTLPNKLNEHIEPSLSDSQDEEKPEKSLHDSKENKDTPMEDSSEEPKDEETAKESKDKPMKDLAEESKDDRDAKDSKEESNSEKNELDDSKEDTVESMEESVEEPSESVEEPSEKSPRKRSRGKAQAKDTPPADTPTRARRDRKKVERFVQETKKEEEVEVEGTGTPLKEIPYIKNMITKTTGDKLKTLHRLAYGRPGSIHDVKRNLNKFRGFPFTKEDKAFERKKINSERLAMAELKKIAEILGLDKKGVKMEVIDRILDFLLFPSDQGKEVPTPKSKKGRSKPKSKKKDEKRTTKKKKPKKSEADSDEESGSEEKSDSDADEQDEEEEEDQEQEEEEEEDSGAESEPEEVKKPKKKAKPTPKKTPKSTQKASKKRPKDEDSDDDDSDDSSNASDENPKKKAKKTPTDGDIKAFIKKLLDKANLEEVTMKKLCQQVYDNYPDQDLSHKKEFIKSTVKSILS